MPNATASPSDVLVIGGGVTGCATALALARAGASVTLVEAGDLGAEASGANAGSLHAQIQYDPFVTLGEGWARAFAPSLDLLTASVARWERLSDEVGVDLEVTVFGGLLVAETDAQMRVLERKACIERAHGIAAEILERDELQRRAPYVDERMAGAAFCPGEGKANPLLATPALAAAAVRHGARVLRRTPVTAIRREHGGFQVTTEAGAIRTGRIVCCAGARTPSVTRMVGVDVPVEAHPMQVAVTEPLAPLVGHLVYFAGAPLTVKQARVGSVLVGGGWPARRHPRRSGATVDLEGLRRNLAVARTVVPALGSARVLRAWTGVNNAVPDQRPIIGELDAVPGFVVGTFPYLGFTAAPELGVLLAQLAMERTPHRELQPFAPSRFA